VAGIAAEARFELSSPNFVMAGLDPAIHDLLRKQKQKAGSDPGLFCSRHSGMRLLAQARNDDEEEQSRPFFFARTDIIGTMSASTRGASPCA
jgi:hypothetical protein